DNQDIHTNNRDSDRGEAAQPQAPAQKTVKPSGPRRERTMLVRYGKMGLIGQFRHSEREIAPGVTHVVVKTERGLELGQIISPFCYSKGTCKIREDKMLEYWQESGPSYPVSQHGTIVRFATDMDLNDQYHLNANVKYEIQRCQEIADRLELKMHVIDAEHLFGGERIIFYFMADGRIDFRDLVKDLAHEYQTRIEMRQVGARDEARLIADYETCGRECCCKNFLKVLQPVNMRMAKLQKATLDPSKISGRCGRLKCCLRYEDNVYNELFNRLPRKNSYVLTDKGPGTVLSTQVLTQLVKIRLDHNERVIAINVDEILEKNYQPKTEKPVQNEPFEEKDIPESHEQAIGILDEDLINDPELETAILADDIPDSKVPPQESGPREMAQESGSDKQRKNRRRRRRRKKNKSSAPTGPGSGN
ncbi:MAG: hypothetical protein JW860_03985, partial [Sedimentisphaerales bacterium]|nr:hypothetical protein [Sedimentisphaerales bacterium]